RRDLRTVGWCARTPGAIAAPVGSCSGSAAQAFGGPKAPGFSLAGDPSFSSLRRHGGKCPPKGAARRRDRGGARGRPRGGTEGGAEACFPSEKAAGKEFACLLSREPEEPRCVHLSSSAWLPCCASARLCRPP